MILDLDDIKEENEKHSEVVGSSEPSFSSDCNLSSNNKSGVIKRVLHSRIEISIYPNGQSYILKSQSWFEDKIYQVKKKVKKKAPEVKKVIKKKMESY